MIYRLLISLLLIASPAQAQEVLTDAFGIVPASDISETRAGWSDIRPTGETAVTILTFVGPKSLTAGHEEGHAMALLFDRAGNLVRDGEAVQFRIAGETQTTQTTDGIADVYFVPAPVAGEFEVGISSGGSQSARAIYRVTADLDSLNPNVVAPSGDLKLETFAEFQTEALVDQFGNAAPSGSGAQIVLTHPDGRFSLTTPNVRNGMLNSNILVRDVTKGGALRASVAGQKSSETAVAVAPMQLAAPTGIRLRAIHSIKAVALAAGPVLTDAGHVLNDGAEVTVSVRGGSGRQITQTGWLRDGFFDTVLAIEPSDLPFEVTFTTILGQERAIFQSLSRPEAAR